MKKNFYLPFNVFITLLKPYEMNVIPLGYFKKQEKAGEISITWLFIKVDFSFIFKL